MNTVGMTPQAFLHVHMCINLCMPAMFIIICLSTIKYIIYLQLDVKVNSLSSSGNLKLKVDKPKEMKNHQSLSNFI